MISKSTQLNGRRENKLHMWWFTRWRSVDDSEYLKN